MDNRALKTLILVAVMAYAVLPDLQPGPMDDLIVMILGYIARKNLSRKEISAG